jgi:NAD(P)-dependent dehydrogenase (short-subunit alcohol dehydrogenase family)
VVLRPPSLHLCDEAVEGGPGRGEVAKLGVDAAAAATATDVTLLVNSAGAPLRQNVIDGDLEIIGQGVATFLWGTLRMLQAFAPILGRSQGPGGAARRAQPDGEGGTVRRLARPVSVGGLTTAHPGQIADGDESHHLTRIVTDHSGPVRRPGKTLGGCPPARPISPNSTSSIEAE